MRYVSTRGSAPELGFTDALLAGLQCGEQLILLALDAGDQQLLAV